VLDANVLMRAVLGHRVRELLERYEDSATFYSPDVCFGDARYYLSQILEVRASTACQIPICITAGSIVVSNCLCAPRARHTLR